MSTLEFGERIGKTAKLSLAVAGFVFDGERRLLLTQRRDNGRWCLPGGHIEPGESIGEACVREALEETGLQTAPVRLLGVSSDPNIVFTYSDGNRWQSIDVDVELRVLDGTPVTTDETIGWGWFTLDELDQIDVMESERWRIEAALHSSRPYVK